MRSTSIGSVMAVVVGVCAAAASGGCSGFDAAYEKALAQGAPAGSIEGAWDGTWTSHGGHGGGRLRAVITRAGPDTYRAWFRAGFWKILEASQEVNLKVSSAPASSGEVRAAGEEDLGWLYGGVYKYEATATPGKFDATYTSKYDRGVFEMARPATGGK
ncbi:MAG TPA: hypothetical protein VEA69_24225 [Tepidisphaeraceae bacterium]|nr:hypothetical protein [Tepidisphaeraceae bacterium]